MKAKTCKHCKTKFIPDRQFQAVCSYNCAIERAKTLQTLKRVREANKAKREYRANDKKVLEKTAVRVCHDYIRERDKGQPCISCGSTTAISYHAGHYMPAGNYKAVKYHELNINLQCSACNTHKSGNCTQYRINLVKKIGADKVEWLESQTHIKSWTIDELKEIIKTYKAKTKALSATIQP